MEFLLYIGLLLAVGFIVVALLPTRGSRKDAGTIEPTGSKYDKLFRIVELYNGLFQVQQWYDWKGNCMGGWGIPDPIGPYTFESLSSAQARKTQLIRYMQEQEGYRVKRVIN